mgnify:FL=1
MAFLGGAAKRGSEIFREEREDAMSTITDELKILTQLGLPRATERNQTRIDNRKIAKDLERQRFNTEQIAVIMGQGKGKEVLNYLDDQRAKYGNKYQIPHGDIVTISGTYEDTGLTIDKILENVQGKVNRGMSTSDAVEDVTGKPATLTEAFGGSMSGLRERKFQAFAESTGVNIDELRGLAAGNITYDAPLRTGTVSLADPAGEGLKTSLLNRFEKSAAQKLGGKNVSIVEGVVQTPDMQAATAVEAGRIAAEANRLYSEIMSRGDTTSEDALITVNAFISQQVATYRDTPPPGDGNTGISELDTLTGMSLSQLPDGIFQALEGVTDAQTIMKIQKEAEALLIQAYKDRGENDAFAEQAAKKQMDRIRERLNKK